MKKIIILGSVLYLALTSPIACAQEKTPPVPIAPKCDPYNNYACLDSYLGEDFITRFFRYYKLEMGHAAAPSDPNAPSSHRAGWPATPHPHHLCHLLNGLMVLPRHWG